ncbi:hypothetical protein [Salinispora arenicola]|uniref:hypothetical protein n=1 Tax=Salinispora arenicola TaxID=168697 RepID=UPI002079D16A|nr:hypothetical protein [Salinispora arenicola]MCN0180099.1 hypothetical protein [Salinispora arenicola]
MTEQFRSAYRALAEEAGSYADPERAIAVARRRRRTRTLALPAVLTIAVAIGTVLVVRPDPDPPPLQTLGPDVTASAQAPAAATPLPATAVGTATLVYAPCRDCSTRVVLTTGAHHLVPSDDVGMTAIGTSLSPDGRWLSYPAGRDMKIRDLTGDRVWTVASSGPQRRVGVLTWSVDSSRILLSDYHDGQDNTYTVLQLGTGTRTTADVAEEDLIVGVLPTGEVLTTPDLLGPSRQRSTRITLTTGTGTAARTIDVDATRWLDTTETVVWHNAVHPAVGGGYSLIVAAYPGEGPDPTAVLRVNAAGEITDRQDIPSRDNRFQYWYVVGSNGSDVLFGKVETLTGQQATTLIAVQPDGHLREITTLPQEAVIRSPGAT